jgi:hypothetical protein
MRLKVQEGTKEFKRPYMDEAIEPSEDGSFRVKKELGQQLLDDSGIEVEKKHRSTGERSTGER